MLDSDLFLVLGILVSAFAIPAVLSAFADSRPPRAAALAVMIGGGLILLAMATKPGGYTPGQIPETFARILARFLNH
ncbi:hypothetical protein H9N28_15360 [Rhodobacter capsulatus]|uniref:hypothetical protein n=1 Tax=Rhodobacter capsulatus TaxID=1061 RepID=UPI0006DCAD22|nr:hypothetical protein [Rhodobacter capsulatus]KQB11651.1 hypothetical protein AP073_08520 [Rhodobacter capsulatus]KQB11768.1 hypothetical protein AP071_09725 [Rhodobacter capsulatus]PZX28627.1 hypothetical protein LY44_00378 [Rhodobacter capsulatus]QNR62904.1 hypothetical protein H9N28_15360 [Rhodobacter capsulatus]